MKKSRVVFLFIALFFTARHSALAQSVGINSSGVSPDSSAMLDLVSTGKGMLVPRISLQSLTDAATIATPATSLLIYNTNSALGTGYYYNSGTSGSVSWVRIVSDGTDWKTEGNAGTNSTTDFLGTTDAEPLIFSTDATQRISISETGNTVIGGATNNTTIEADGTLMLNGSATTWDDMLFPFTKAENNNVTFSNSTVTLTFPSRDASKEIYMIGQLPHRWKVGSTIYPHIHWQQGFANPTPPDYINFRLLYKWFNLGSAVPGSWTTINTTDANGNPYVASYSSGNMHQISAWPGIDGTGKTISSIILIKVYRYDPTTGTSSNIPGFQFDFHYEMDMLGSHEALVK